MRNCHLNCALCHSDVIDGVYHDRKWKNYGSRVAWYVM
jgi:hypothetical protein